MKQPKPVFFAYDDVAKLMVLKDYDLILNPLKVASGLPLPLQSIISKKFTFSINLTEDSFSTRSKRQYLVKHILERSDRRQSALYLTGSGSNTQPALTISTTSARPQTSIQIPDTPQINQEVLQIAGTSESVC
jgi:hypothetical protein